MSAQAIFATTAALRTFLRSALSSGRSVTLLPPGEDPPVNGSGVNVYLYQVGESPYLRNSSFPGDRAGAPPRERPVLSLELSYLITPFGPTPGADDASDEAHGALGEAMLALHDAPVLNHVHRSGFDADTDLAAVLRDSFEELRVRPHPLSVEDLSRIWSTIGKPYRLSAAYQVSLVQLRGAEPTVAVAPVARARAVVDPRSAPRVAALVPARGAVATLSGGAVVPGRLRLQGESLAAPGLAPAVTVAGAPAHPVGPATAESLTVELPRTPPTGPRAEVRVVLGGRPSGESPAFRIDPWAAAVTPVRTAFGASATSVVVTGSGLAGAVELVATDATDAVRWSVPVDPARTDDTTAAADLPAGQPAGPEPGAVPNGRYDLRVRLAGGALTNPRTFLVVPLLKPVTGAADGSGYDAAQRLLTLRGARLDGADVRLRVDGVEYELDGQPDPASFTHRFARPLPAGGHTVDVLVDGLRSDTIEVSA
ncbi:DUF4255 domain-containing protein [Kitasatospora sp. A2-31]|uniref:DUF4255 domain-containing protein n=1 Tax=Kitasatospora sp. A2-31 TaxID=2916414 RepID=UPI001EE9FE14|nr:DUF4255 domain-containing protein [Kitasatospora sp. A2-31]MCG6495459.1 Pvc16 family protein [Kitasatospora sp. A2-31]